MKKGQFLWMAVICVCMLLGGASQAQDHFYPVENTGNVATIIIVNGNIDGALFNFGDEIGVYDGTLCVGAVVFKGTFPLSCPSILEYQTPTGVLSGAKPGRDIRFRVWQKQSNKEAEGSPSFTSGGRFGDILTVVNPLKANLTSPVDESDSQRGPSQFFLSQNHPNPFNPSTKLVYNLPLSSRIRIVVYDMYGKQIRTLINGRKSAGQQTVTWDGKDEKGRAVSSGHYIIRMDAENYSKTRKVILAR